MHQVGRISLSDRERLEEILGVLCRLDELSDDHVLVVEGRKDVRALEALGLSGDFFQVQSGGGPVNAAEYVESRGGKAVILTDWDRRGDSLECQLVQVLGKDNPDIDRQVRTDLCMLCKSFIKDIESLDTFVDLLRSRIDPPAKLYETN